MLCGGRWIPCAIAALAAVVAATVTSCGRIGFDDVSGATRAGDAAPADAAPAGDAPTPVDAAPPVDTAPLPADTARPLEAAPPSPDTAPPVDTRTPGAPRSCWARYPGALFCDDFEDGLAPHTTEYGAYLTPMGRIDLESAIVARGRHAAWMHAGEAGLTAPNARLAALFFRLPAPVTTGSLFARMFMYAPADYAAPDWLVALELGDPGDARVKLVHTRDDVLDFSISTANFSTNLGPRSLTRARWLCIEFAVTVANGNVGRGEMFVDGVSRVVLPRGNTRPAAGWTTVNFGVIADPNAVGANLIIDDVVIAATRIGCQ